MIGANVLGALYYIADRLQDVLVVVQPARGVVPAIALLVGSKLSKESRVDHVGL